MRGALRSGLDDDQSDDEPYEDFASDEDAAADEADEADESEALDDDADEDAVSSGARSHEDRPAWAAAQADPRSPPPPPGAAAAGAKVHGGRMLNMCASLWSERPSTVYFAYPRKDVRTTRSGDAPVPELLGTRKLNYRCFWERNCVKNAFALAGFRRVRDGTELNGGKGERDDESQGPMEYLGGLLGLNETQKAPKSPRRGRRRREEKPEDAPATRLAWCASWTKHPGPEIYATQNRYQRVNHFPGSWCVGRKDRLLRTLQRARKRGAKAAAAYNFIPEGYNLPAELKALEGKAKLDKGGVWIVKPCASSCGRGIRLSSSKDVANGALPKDKKLVVQRYVDAPFLGVNGRKFDLRLYCLVTSLDPLVAYIHEDGLVRFSTHAYTMRNLKCRYVHLTNYSVNKKSRRYVEADDEPVGDDAETPKGVEGEDAFKWPLQKLWQWLDENGRDSEVVKKRCRDLIVKTLIAAEAEMTPHSYRSCGPPARPPGAPAPGKRPCFELFGFDVLLDADLKPWLIEVNISPSLMGNSALDRHIKGRLVADVFHTTGFEPYSPARVRRERRADARARLDRAQGRGPTGEGPTKKAQAQDAWRRSGRPEDILLEKLGADEWDLVCHAEDELRRALSGGFARAWPPPPLRYEASPPPGAPPWSHAAAAKAAQAARQAADEYLPLFECLRFSDCLLARAATLPVKRLYEHCPLGAPARLLPPRRAQAPAPAPSRPPSAGRLGRQLVAAVVRGVGGGISQNKPPVPRRSEKRSAPPPPVGPASPRVAPRRRNAPPEGRVPPPAGPDGNRRPPKPRPRGTAKSEAASAFRRARAACDRAPRPAPKEAADRFRVVDDFSWPSLSDIFIGAASAADEDEVIEDAKQPPPPFPERIVSPRPRRRRSRQPDIELNPEIKPAPAIANPALF